MCYQVKKTEGRRDSGNSQGIVRKVGERLYVVGTVHRRLESKARTWPKRLFPLCWTLTSCIKINRTQPNPRRGGGGSEAWAQESAVSASCDRESSSMFPVLVS